MKKKRNVMLLILLLVMVASGIMYAAINGKTLTINGYAHAKANDENFKVKFVNLESGEAALEASAPAYFSESVEGNSATIADDQTASFHVVFNSKGSQYVILKVKNDSASLAARVTANVTVDEETSQDITGNASFNDLFSITEPLNLASTLKYKSATSLYDLDDEDEDEEIEIAAGEYAYVRVNVNLLRDVTSDVGYDGSGNLTEDYAVTIRLHATPVNN